MLLLPRKVIALLRRWSRQQDASLTQMIEGKTAGTRLRGHGRGERVENKFFLLAAAPFCVIMMAGGSGWRQSAFWEILMCLSIAWAVFVIGYMVAALAKTTKKLGVRADERYDSKGKFLLPPEYRNTESATKAKRSRQGPD